MGNGAYRADYLRHEDLYAADPARNGWNDAEVDEEIRAWVGELLRHAHLTPPASVLEVGCGMGNLAIPLSTAGFRVTGIDISATAIAVAVQRAATADCDARFYVGNVAEPATYSGLGTFECVLDGLCWHCMVGGDRAAFLSGVAHALGPNGHFLVMTMCGDPRRAQMKAHFDPVTRYVVAGHVAQRYLGRLSDLEKELDVASLAVDYRRVIQGNDETGDQDMFLAVAEKRHRRVEVR